VSEIEFTEEEQHDLIEAACDLQKGPSCGGPAFIWLGISTIAKILGWPEPADTGMRLMVSGLTDKISDMGEESLGMGGRRVIDFVLDYGTPERLDMRDYLVWRDWRWDNETRPGRHENPLPRRKVIRHGHVLYDFEADTLFKAIEIHARYRESKACVGCMHGSALPARWNGTIIPYECSHRREKGEAEGERGEAGPKEE